MGLYLSIWAILMKVLNNKKSCLQRKMLIMVMHLQIMDQSVLLLDSAIKFKGYQAFLKIV